MRSVAEHGSAVDRMSADLVHGLSGVRVRLRSFTESDVTKRYIGWLNDPEVVRYSNQRFRRHDRASCLRYLASFVSTPNLFVSVHRLDDGAAIGTMTAYIAPPHGTVDVGIMIGDRSVWGQGYGQDAWDTLTRRLLARPDIRKLTAGTLACNLGMIKLMERSGMVLEAVREAQEIVNDVPVDVHYYANFSAR